MMRAQRDQILLRDVNVGDIIRKFEDDINIGDVIDMEEGILLL